MPIKDTLTSLGLTPNESSVYIELLKLGSSPASILGRKTGLPRTTARFTCNQLYKKGLIHRIEKENSFIFSIDSPERLGHLLEQKELKLEQQKAELNRSLGEMKKLMPLNSFKIHN